MGNKDNPDKKTITTIATTCILLLPRPLWERVIKKAQLVEVQVYYIDFFDKDQSMDTNLSLDMKWGLSVRRVSG